MGQEASCSAHFDHRSSTGKAKLESESLLFRGDFRLLIRFSEVISVAASGGRLEIAWPPGTVTFELGPLAEKWATKIRSPKSLLDKLGLKPGARVLVRGFDDAGFLHQLEERQVEVLSAARGADMIFQGVESRGDLQALAGAVRTLKPVGALWVVFPKGQRQITESDVMAAGKSAGLVDVKVISFSPTHTALKFVIPVKSRTR